MGLWWLVIAVAQSSEKETAWVAARDGTQMRTVIIRPRDEGPFPTVFTRTPYPLGLLLAEQCRGFVRRGYACGWQEVRGRLKSEGDWYPFIHEVSDGQDAVAWIREQPWSDGQVAWVGDSYLAATGWAVAMDEPDGVTTLVSRVFAPPLYDASFEDGLVRHTLITSWMVANPGFEANPFGRLSRALAHRPRQTADEAAVGRAVLWYRDIIDAETPAAARWTASGVPRFEHAADNMRIPVMLIAGWSDAFVEVQLDAWSRLPGRNALIVGPWAHLGQTPSDIPLRGLSESAGGGQMAQLPWVYAWLDTQVRGLEPPDGLYGAHTYVVGGGRWEHRAEWPPPTTERLFHLVPREERCAGILTEADPPSHPPFTWTYDPADPFPSRGGAGILAGFVPPPGVKPGFVRVPDLCPRRSDVWQFESEALSESLHFAGSVALEMEVASSAPDSAFGFRLLLRQPSGRLIMLREGFATLALNGAPTRTRYTPGTRMTLTADAQPLEAELQPGESLVVVLTSSSFPVVEAHPNRDGVLADVEKVQTAQQRVFSATLRVPVVSGSR